jgi:hypothetical protein
VQNKPGKNELQARAKTEEFKKLKDGDEGKGQRNSGGAGMNKKLQ